MPWLAQIRRASAGTLSQRPVCDRCGHEVAPEQWDVHASTCDGDADPEA